MGRLGCTLFQLEWPPEQLAHPPSPTGPPRLLIALCAGLHARQREGVASASSPSSALKVRMDEQRGVLSRPTMRPLVWA